MKQVAICIMVVILLSFGMVFAGEIEEKQLEVRALQAELGQLRTQQQLAQEIFTKLQLLIPEKQEELNRAQGELRKLLAPKPEEPKAKKK